MNVNEFTPRNNRDIWNFSDYSNIRTHNHLVCKQILNYLAKQTRLVRRSSVRLQSKWLEVQISLHSLRNQ